MRGVEIRNQGVNLAHSIRGTRQNIPVTDENSFGGDVVLDSFNKATQEEDNILEKVYHSKYVRIILMILILYKIIRKCLLSQQ